MNTKTILIFSALMTTSMIFSILLSVGYASTVDQSSEETVPVRKAVGRGLILFHGRRETFFFNVSGGRFRNAYGWRYMPRGKLSFTVRNRRSNRLIQLRSSKIWRFRIREIDGGFRAVIMGIAEIDTRIGLLKNWWFRVDARDIDKLENWKDGFSISLWRPIGAGREGGWSARQFRPREPSSLHLNSVPFYRAFGRLRRGSIEITMIDS